MSTDNITDNKMYLIEYNLNFPSSGNFGSCEPENKNNYQNKYLLNIVRMMISLHI